ncbi:sigma-70 family RNA polymerase sigma factor [Foetidibacter luteolus]|uniref:sigma-70 family RNA polymerase sigma factor n=1 Tax=Foetidibacter luteolus TaxID=2608880 RepID=UPI00129A79C0|nr:sigma-70 family RNA polymerase sigma factor [Foetidibacter luteolus]
MEALRPLLTTYAYNILGSLEEAKDVVQDAFLKFMHIDASRIDDKKAYLVRTVINLSINAKKKLQKMKAGYTGEWLPEPIATEQADTAINRREVLSYSLMVLLEKLNPKQRAVFILKEAFDYDHEEIARALDITVENSRKLLSRAKSQLKEDALPDSSVPPGYLGKYLEVIQKGDTARLEQLLNEDIVAISDGGGKAPAFINPIYGRKDVIAGMLGIFKKTLSMSASLRLEEKIINHQPALYYYVDDKLVTCQIFSVREGIIENIWLIRNPDKLKSLEKIS